MPCGAEESASPVGCCHRRWQSDPLRGSETMSTTVREVRMIEQPGHLGRRPKATWRREQIQGLRVASAQSADICEGSETMSATVREARMIEQLMIPLHPVLCQHPEPLTDFRQRSACQKRSHNAAFFAILRIGDEDAKERSGAAPGDRNVVHRYAGTQGTLAAEDRRSGEFCAHIRIGRRLVLRG